MTTKKQNWTRKRNFNIFRLRGASAVIKVIGRDYDFLTFYTNPILRSMRQLLDRLEELDSYEKYEEEVRSWRKINKGKSS